MVTYDTAVGGVLWSEDIFQLTNLASTHYYYRVTSRSISQRYSSNNGLTWYGTVWGGTPVATNSRIGAAPILGGTSSDYAVAYSDAATGGVNVVRTDGAAVPHHRFDTYAAAVGGPTVASGNGLLVMAFARHSTSPSWGRRIRYYASTDDGVTWTGPDYLSLRTTPGQNEGSMDYSSKWEPLVAFDPNTGYFIMAWVDWRHNASPGARGLLRTCISDDPSSTHWSGCVTHTGRYAHTTPGIACRPNNACVLRWSNYSAVGNYQFESAYGAVDTNPASGAPAEFTIVGGPYAETETSTLGVGLAANMAPHSIQLVEGWRGDDFHNWGQTKRSFGYPYYWTDRRYQDYWLQAAPTVSYHPVPGTVGDFDFFYVQR